MKKTLYNLQFQILVKFTLHKCNYNTKLQFLQSHFLILSRVGPILPNWKLSLECALCSPICDCYQDVTLSCASHNIKKLCLSKDIFTSPFLLLVMLSHRSFLQFCRFVSFYTSPANLNLNIIFHYILNVYQLIFPPPLYSRICSHETFQSLSFLIRLLIFKYTSIFYITIFIFQKLYSYFSQRYSTFWS